MALHLRIPAHSPLLLLKVNGNPIVPKVERGYAHVDCAQGDTEIALLLDLKPRYIYADVRVSSDAGKVALTQGPLAYCFEQADNGEGLSAMLVDPAAAPEICACAIDPAANGLRVKGYQESNGEDRLYSTQPPSRVPRTLAAIPYYCWNHRGRGEMRVWMRRSE